MVKGIDVSYHNGTINWSKVKADGVEFAIVRAGYGVSTKDKQFESNIRGCIANGIKVGVYWFLYCTNEAEAKANADKCNEVIKAYKPSITMKVWCDFEYDTEKKANAKGIVFTQQSRTACMVAFIERMKYHGYEVGNYVNPDYLSKINKLDYPMWLAKYSSNKGSYDPLIWQYSSKGVVDGISGNVDMNWGYFDVAPISTKTEVYNQAQFIQDVEAILGVTTTKLAFEMAVTISTTTNKNHALVTPIERYMKSLGYYNGSIEADNNKTPCFGKGMASAVAKYQKEVVGSSQKFQDGIVTHKCATWKKMLGLA